MSRYLLLLCLALPAIGQAETLYVIDRVEIGLHESSEPGSPILQLLPTGTALEVLERRNGRARVRLNNDTTGWVDADMLIPSEPTRERLNIARAKLEAAQAELNQLRQQQAETDAAAEPDEVQTLRATRERLEQELADERAEVLKLSRQLAQLSATGARASSRMLPAWVPSSLLAPRYLIAALVIMLLLGVLLGAWLIDSNNRRRHGGFRV